MTTGYPRFPTIHGDTIVYVAEDDLWSVPAAGGTARRLTAGVAAASHPVISPDGDWIAYTGEEEGPPEVHVVPIGGGEGRRLTFEGGLLSKVVGWSRDGESVMYSSSVAAPNVVDMRLRRILLGGGKPEQLPYGRATSVAYGDNGVEVLGREYWKDSAHWKRYRGGTVGKLWIDAGGDGQFSKLVNLDGNLSCPHIIGDRVYFLSDHEGYANVYSTAFDGTGLARHSDHAEYYARGLSGDGARLVYHSGGKLYLLDPAQDQPQELQVHTPVTRTQRARRFVAADAYLDSVDVRGDGSRLAVTTRGKAFSLANWEGPVTQYGETDGVRYRSLTWLHDGERMVAVAGDTAPAERLVGWRTDGAAWSCRMDKLALGRVREIVASPIEGKLAVTNHRNELLVIDVDGEEAVSKVIDTSQHGEICDATFSPDGKWLAYSLPMSIYEEDSPARATLMLAEVETGRTVVAAKRILSDHGPAFDPEGKYLYFLGVRRFNPVYDSLHFDLNFPIGTRPYAIALRGDVEAPFIPQPQPMFEAMKMVKTTDAEEVAVSADTTAADSETVPELVDPEGITTRVVPVPVGEAEYTKVLAAKGKLLVLSEPVEAGVRALDPDGSEQGMLDSVDLSTGKIERIADGVTAALVTPDGKTLLYFAGDQLRVVKATEKAPDSTDYNRESGWVDLSRIRVSVRPELEWPQMFREAWRLLSENFWTEDMSGVDWNAIYDRYAPLVDKVSTRGELSDLIWEMNGELGTSHVYERGGDYRPGPHYVQGYLGAEFAVEPGGGYRITEIFAGDIGDPEASSPLFRPGTDVRVGDVVLAVNGQPVTETVSVAQRLVNQAGEEVRLTLRRGDGDPRDVTVKALASESALRYREWVEANRAAVSAATGGRVGYIHVPDMGADGFAEFHRGFLNSYDHDALIVDVRFNGGGHVSPLLLEKLARRRIGYAHPRWSNPSPYPRESPSGPMVALTNELAGSDGDIFCAGFKQLGLGTLIGTRTWGGVVGYFPWRPRLSDGTFLSQPEVAFHFDEAKWGVENYGVDPDIVVDYPPQDFAAGRDPQLAKAIEVVLAELVAHPAHRPAPADRPKLTAPKLPPRP